MVKDKNFGKFTSKTKEQLAMLSAHLCSNPSCRHKALYLGAGGAMLNCGEAAHIFGRMPGTARHEPLYAESDVQSIANGIWLCGRCHKIVDNDGITYPAKVLKAWKALAEGELTYSSPTPTITPPGHLWDQGAGCVWIGTHVLVAPCDIPGVVTKLELEIISPLGSSVCSPTKYYDPVLAMGSNLKHDWRRFLFKSGLDDNLYFLFESTTPAVSIPNGTLLLFRLKVTGRYNHDEISVYSDWELVVTSIPTIPPPPNSCWTPRFDAVRNATPLLKIGDILHRIKNCPNGQTVITQIMNQHSSGGKRWAGSIKHSLRNQPLRPTHCPDDEKIIGASTEDNAVEIQVWSGGYAILERYGPPKIGSKVLTGSLTEHWGWMATCPVAVGSRWRQYWETSRSKTEGTLYNF